MALAVASVIEFLQSVPARFEWMHSAGEVLRNVGYAVFAAYVFNYFLAELPQRRRAAGAIRASISALESIATKPSQYFAACLQGGGVVLSRDVRGDDELGDLMKKQLSDENGEINPSALDLAILERLLREIDERFASISPYLPNFPPDLAADVTRFKEDFARVPILIKAGFTLSTFLQPLQLGRKFAEILLRNIDDDSLQKFLKPYATSFVQAKRTAPEFKYSEESHYDAGENRTQQYRTYFNPVAATRWELENEQPQSLDGQAAANSDLMSSFRDSSPRSFRRDVISILQATAQEIRKAWSVHKANQRLDDEDKTFDRRAGHPAHETKMSVG